MRVSRVEGQARQLGQLQNKAAKGDNQVQRHSEGATQEQVHDILVQLQSQVAGMQHIGQIRRAIATQVKKYDNAAPQLKPKRLTKQQKEAQEEERQQQQRDANARAEFDRKFGPISNPKWDAKQTRARCRIKVLLTQAIDEKRRLYHKESGRSQEQWLEEAVDLRDSLHYTAAGYTNSAIAKLRRGFQSEQLEEMYELARHHCTDA